jgi:glutamate---cysteine ligase / carboxylate-amine ligase
MERPAFTLCVEEEFQILDPETRELRSHVQEILEEGRLILKERVKPEMHQSVIEIGTGICQNVQEVR